LTALIDKPRRSFPGGKYSIGLIWKIYSALSYPYGILKYKFVTGAIKCLLKLVMNRAVSQNARIATPGIGDTLEMMRTSQYIIAI
jgi:hypothetical protein